MRTNGQILIVSKPLAPPWNDSGKNVVRDLLENIDDLTFRVFTPKGYVYPKDNVISEQLYSGPGDYAPPLKQNLKVFKRLIARDREVALCHFFYTPNLVSNVATNLALKISRKAAMLTATSSPDSAKDLLFLGGMERVIVLSQYSARKFMGFGQDRIRHLPPGIPILPPISAKRRRERRRELGLAGGPVVLYPGDYEFSQAAWTMLEAFRPILGQNPGATLIYACRIKQPPSKVIERQLRMQAHRMGLLKNIIFLNEIDHMRELLAAADLVAFPVDSLRAKMDAPLVLLEALAEEVPVVVGDIAPLRELVDEEGRIGCRVPPGDPKALAAAINKLLADKKRLRAMGRLGRQLVASKYDAKLPARTVRDIYLELMR